MALCSVDLRELAISSGLTPCRRSAQSRWPQMSMASNMWPASSSYSQWLWPVSEVGALCSQLSRINEQAQLPAHPSMAAAGLS